MVQDVVVQEYEAYVKNEIRANRTPLDPQQWLDARANPAPVVAQPKIKPADPVDTERVFQEFKDIMLTNGHGTVQAQLYEQFLKQRKIDIKG